MLNSIYIVHKAALAQSLTLSPRGSTSCFIQSENLELAISKPDFDTDFELNLNDIESPIFDPLIKTRTMSYVDCVLGLALSF